MLKSLLLGPFGRVMAANFMFFMNFASFFLLPLFVKEKGGSEGTVGLVMATGGLATLLVLPLVGSWIDRIGRRTFFVAGSVAMSAAALAYAGVGAIGPALFALRVLQGVSFAAAFTASTTMAAELAPSTQRARALGLFGVSTLLTHALAPSLGEEIIHRFGFRTLFLLVSLFPLAAIALVGRYPGFTTATDTPHRATPGLPRLHWFMAAITTLSAMGFGSVMNYTPTFVHAEGLGRVGIFFTAYTITAIGSRIGGGGVSDRFGRIPVIVPALLLLSTSIFLLSRVGSATGLFFAGAVFGLAQGTSYPTIHAFLVDTAPPAALGRAQALFNGSFNLGVMSSGLLFGQIADHLGHRATFCLAALPPLLAAGLLPWVGSSRPGPASRAPAGHRDSA